MEIAWNRVELLLIKDFQSRDLPSLGTYCISAGVQSVSFDFLSADRFNEEWTPVGRGVSQSTFGHVQLRVPRRRLPETVEEAGAVCSAAD